MRVERRPGTALRWENCYNVRDLGGYETVDGRRTRFGAFVRADNLSRLTSDGRTALQRYGVRTVIDLRSPFELEMDPPPFGESGASHDVRYRNLPLIEQDSMNAQAIATAATNSAMYRAVIHGCAGELVAILRAMVEAPEGCILIHCHAGKDRTGIVAAIVLRVAGVAPECIAEDYAASNDRLRPYYDEVLADISDVHERASTASQYFADPDIMLDLLQYIERKYGGIERYLRNAGLKEGEIEALRARLIG